MAVSQLVIATKKGEYTLSAVAILYGTSNLGESPLTFYNKRVAAGHEIVWRAAWADSSGALYDRVTEWLSKKHPEEFKHGELSLADMKYSHVYLPALRNPNNDEEYFRQIIGDIYRIVGTAYVGAADS